MMMFTVGCLAYIPPWTPFRKGHDIMIVPFHLTKPKLNNKPKINYFLHNIAFLSKECFVLKACATTDVVDKMLHSPKKRLLWEVLPLDQIFQDNQCHTL